MKRSGSVMKWTEDQWLRREQKRQANRIAAHLESVAARIRGLAESFDKADRDPHITAADIANEYTQSGGMIGGMLWAMVSELRRTR